MINRGPQLSVERECGKVFYSSRYSVELRFMLSITEDTFAARISLVRGREREVQRAIYNFLFSLLMTTERAAQQDEALERCICLRFSKRTWE